MPGLIFDGPFVSIVMAVSDPAGRARRAVETLLSTDYPAHKLEIVLAINASAIEGDRLIFSPSYRDARVKQVVERYDAVAEGLNSAIKASRGEVVLVANERAEYPTDFIRQHVRGLIDTNADCVGGFAAPVADHGGVISSVLAQAAFSPFARFRSVRRQARGFAEWVSHGAYRRSAFERVGLFQPRWASAFELELQDRIRNEGGAVYQTDRIYSRVAGPESARDAMQASFAEGLWAARTHGAQGRVRRPWEQWLAAGLVYFPMLATATVARYQAGGGWASLFLPFALPPVQAAFLAGYARGLNGFERWRDEEWGWEAPPTLEPLPDLVFIQQPG